MLYYRVLTPFNSREPVRAVFCLSDDGKPEKNIVRGNFRYRSWLKWYIEEIYANGKVQNNNTQKIPGKAQKRQKKWVPNRKNQKS